MDAQEIESLLSKEESSATLKKAGIGLNNVNERIKMFYGDQYGLLIESKPGEGTCVNIFIPKVIEAGGTSYVENSNR